MVATLDQYPKRQVLEKLSMRKSGSACLNTSNKPEDAGLTDSIHRFRSRVRVADGTGLLTRQGLTPLVSSNLTDSANVLYLNINKSYDCMK